MLDLLKKIKDNVVSVLGVVVTVLLGWLIYEKTQKDADEALLKDSKTHEQIDTLDADIKKNDDIDKAEQAKRDAIVKQMETDKNEKPTDDELLDYFNKPKSDS